jgi:hypothetical protein
MEVANEKCCSLDTTSRVEISWETCGQENNIRMDLKEEAGRDWNAFIRQAEDAGPMAGPGFTQSKDSLFYLLPASQYSK